MKRFRRNLMDRTQEMQKGSRIVGGFIGLLFLGVGISVLVFLWGAPFGEFHSPPIFFRVFGSFIALMFVVLGGGACFSLLRGTPSRGDLSSSGNVPDSPETGTSPPPGAYRCSHCGAPLADTVEVSPHGDVRCSYCKSWFNIHKGL